MMTKIKILSNDVINQIAAGEVVENPTSVIKELVENSIDAKATKINISIKAAGFQEIRIDDDGIGMSKEDLFLAIKRHATSKIENTLDILKILTKGFRGEALASIAAISKMKITSSTDGINATSIKIEGGRVISVEAASRKRGTTIEILSLFFNTPVRRKFQKSLVANVSTATKTISQIFLAHPEVGFSFKSDDKLILSSERYLENSLEKILKFRILDIFSKDYLKDFTWISRREKDFFIYGYISWPTLAKRTKNSQYLLLNNYQT